MTNYFNFVDVNSTPTKAYIEMLSTQSIGKHNNESVSYDGRYLRVESIKQTISRQPIVLSLPRGTRNNPLDAMPQGYVIDFGSMTENITISGICLDGDDGRIANYVWLTQLARTGWFSTKADVLNDSFKTAGGVRLGILECGEGQTDYGYSGDVRTFTESTQWFQGVISGFNASRDGGQLKWDWQLTLSVGAWPLDKNTFRTMYRTS